MKLLRHSFLLLLTRATDGFSPPRLTSKSSAHVQLAAQASAKSEIELEKQQRHRNNQKRWGRTHKFRAKKTRPFYDLSLDELKALTEYHLDLKIKAADEAQNSSDGSQEKAEATPSNQVHQLSKLIASWSKLVSAGYITKINGEESNAVILTKKDKVMAAEMAEECLRYLVNGQNVVSMDMYHSVITAWVKSGSHSDLMHATSLLDYMESNGHNSFQTKESTGPDIETTESSTKCYVAVLDGWCKSPYKDAAEHAEAVLQRMVSLGIHSVKHFNNVLNLLASSGKPSSGEDAECLLNEMIEMYKAGDFDMAPTKSSFNTVIKAYAYSGGKHGSRNAKRILSMMDNSSKFGLEDIASEIEPDRVSCTSIMMAWANGNEYGACDVDAGEKAEQLLNRMENKNDRTLTPDTASYNAVLKVWGKCGHHKAAQRSEELLNRMLKQYEEGRNLDAKPDEITFNSVIHNIATSPDLDSPQRAQCVLEKMQYCHEHGIIDAKPSIISYNSLLNSFAKSNRPGSAQQAEEILNNLEKSYDSGAWNIEPDVYSYNTVISAWSNSNEEQGASRAVALLDRMSTRAKDKKSNVKPDTTTYNTVLHAWSQSTDRNAPIKALGLLELMFRYYNNGNQNAKPDEVSFSTVINAFSKSTFTWKARECRNLLRRMQNLYDEGQDNMKPNIFVYSAVLNACAYTFGREEEKQSALNIGIETWEELKNSGIRINHVAYGSFLRICRRLMPVDDSRRNHFITRAFKQCCSDGQVGVYVLKQIRADHKIFNALLQAYIVDGEVEYEDLPSEWTRNVRERRRSYTSRINRSM